MRRLVIVMLMVVAVAGCGSLRLAPGQMERPQATDALPEDSQQQDAWALADGLFELGAGVAGLFGGVYAARLVRAVDEARKKSRALKEIVEGNELFKKRNPATIADFKEAQSLQSQDTRRLVASLK